MSIENGAVPDTGTGTTDDQSRGGLFSGSGAVNLDFAAHRGAQGPAGPTGPEGPAGPAGATGPTGADGTNAGPAGADGCVLGLLSGMDGDSRR